jgi:FkbM family methyltransferase
MSRVLDHLRGSVYRTARYVATSAGFEESVWGRKVLARLNIIGEKVGRMLVLRGRPFKVDGHLMYLAGRSGPSVSFSTELLSERYEPETGKILKEILRPGMNVLDIGAHVGCHALLAARLVGPEGKVYAFEAAPDNFALLQKNIALNGYRNILPVPKAVAEKTGTVTFCLSPEGNDRNSIYASSRAGELKKTLEVPAVSLDDFLEQEGWPKIDFVKIDVEGAEPLVLKGMTRLLDRSSEITLIAEFAPACIRDGGCAPAGFLEALANCGFQIRVLEREGSSTPLHSERFASFAKHVESEGMKNLMCYRQTNRPAAAEKIGR